MAIRTLFAYVLPFVLVGIALASLAGCPSTGGDHSTSIDLPSEIIGTWELHDGGTITFNTDGSFATSEATEGAYEVVGQSLVLDITGVEGKLNQVMTCLGRFPDGSLLFSLETPLGLTRVSR